MSDEELIKKWKMVLNYTDKDTPELSEFKKLYLAVLMENHEQYFHDKPNLLKIIIPQIRRNEGPLEKVEIGNRLWDIVRIYNINGEYVTYAIDIDDVRIEFGNHPAYRETYLSNCWEMKDGNWCWNDW